MVAAPLIEAGGGSGPYREPLPRRATIPYRIQDDPSARSALDISDARELIAKIASGAPPLGWIDTLLSQVRFADVNDTIVQMLAPFAGAWRMIGQPVSAFWPPESRPVLAELIMAAVADYPTGAPRTRASTSLGFTDCEVTISTSEDDASPDILIVSVGGTVMDDRSLWMVRASEQRYRNLLHHLPFALLQVDARQIGAVYEGLRRSGVTDLQAFLDEHPDLIDTANALVMVTEVNASAVTLFGVDSVADLVGPVGYLFAASPESARRVMTARFEGRRSYAEVMKLRTFDGRLLDVAITLTYPRPPERLDVTLISVEDITDRLGTDAQLRQLQADYSRAARISMLGELATSIAHEVNQPLSAIVTNAETSLRWLQRPEPNLSKVGQLMSRVAESARRASEIVQRIRGMAGRNAPEQSALDLNDIVYEALVFVRHDLETRAIALTLQLGTGLPGLLGDRVQLQQVVVNLLLNAAQALAMDQSAGRIDVVTAISPDGMLLFSIRDNGLGIAHTDFDRVFDSFFTTKEDGVGIGLAICQSIITAHGGAITASNHPDGGAIFTVLLPPIAPE